jgi:hypothetical protein
MGIRDLRYLNNPYYTLWYVREHMNSRIFYIYGNAPLQLYKDKTLKTTTTTLRHQEGRL